jgi:hypothetical protein
MMKEILAIDAQKCTGYSIPIGMFEKVIRVAKKQPSLKQKIGRFQRGNR